MRYRELYVLLAALALVVMISGCGDRPPKQNENPQFTAMLSEDYNGNVQNYKIAIDAGRIRLDVQEPGSGTIIIRGDRNVLWALMTKKKLFLELPIRPENKNPLVIAPDKIIKYKKLGEETIDGHPAIKELMTIQNEGDAQKSFYRWFATDLNWPIKAEDENGKWKLSLKGITPGPQDPALFEPPAEGYMMIKPNVPGGKSGGPH